MLGVMETTKSNWDVLEPAWDAVSIYDGGAVFLEQYQRVTFRQQVLFATHWAMSEICNGGHHQFFSNSTGVLAPEASAGFRILGMQACSAAIESAIAFFGNPFPRDRETRTRKLGEYQGSHSRSWDPFQEQDDNFFDHIHTECGGFEAVATRFAFGSAA